MSSNHGMIPGTHEWPRTPQCRCGADWYRWNDRCADQLIAAGLTMPAPPAVCGASAVIAGVEYVCDRERGHAEPIHECTDDVGFMRRWFHATLASCSGGSDGWPLND